MLAYVLALAMLRRQRLGGWTACSASGRRTGLLPGYRVLRAV
ncbi:hypothetical protein ACFOPN_22205 [Xanthomonas hyacinthi]